MWVRLDLLYWRHTKSWLLGEISLVLQFFWVHAVSGACSCCISKRGKRNTTGGCPSRREMMALLLLALAFLPQPSQSGSRSMGFPSATALVLFRGWWCVQTWTSPGSSVCGGTGVATSIWKPSHSQQSSAPLPGDPHRHLQGEGQSRRWGGWAGGEKANT